jgi:hypothetical protein
LEDEFDSFAHSELWQDRDLIAEVGIDLEKMMIFDYSGVETMTSLVVDDMDLRPRRGQEHTSMIAMRLVEFRRHGLARHALEARRSVYQTSIKEDPPFEAAGVRMVSHSQFEGATQEGRFVHPWKRCAAIL